MIFKGNYRLTSGYRLPNRPSHKGLDLVGVDDKTVYSPVDGTVKSSTIITDKSNLTWEWGNYVRMDDSAGNRLFFCHLASRAVTVGQKVTTGDKLGVMGYTGYCVPAGAGGTHTHFEVRNPQNVNIDPAKYLGIPNKIGSYTGESAAVKGGWSKTAAGWQYVSADGALYRSKWLQEGERWYWFNANGIAVTGFQTVQGKRYYFAEKEDKAKGIKECQMIQTDEKGAIV